MQRTWPTSVVSFGLTMVALVVSFFLSLGDSNSENTPWWLVVPGIALIGGVVLCISARTRAVGVGILAALCLAGLAFYVILIGLSEGLRDS
jgi:membrane protein CcdC involved in cytochrome C biogenesis